MTTAGLRSSGLALALCFASASAPAQQTQQTHQTHQTQQTQTSTYQPLVGQAGKDVVWVPTPQVLVDKMLDIAKVTPNDYVIDLGSGDGRTVIAAVKRGARALGMEYNPQMVELAQRSAEQEAVAGRARFVKQDLFEADLSQATVITMFLLPDINLKLRPKLLALKPGTRVVSNTFTMGEWTPDEKVELDRDAGCNTSWCTALLWIVPAQVGGTHEIPQGKLSLKQTFQMLSGMLQSEGKTIPVEGKVLGDQVWLNAGGRELRGTVNGKRLELR